MSQESRQVQLDAYVIDVLLPDLVGHDKRPAAFLLYVGLWSATRRGGKASAFLSYQRIAEGTGLSKSACQRAIAWLVGRRLVKVKRKSRTAVPEYAVLTPWARGGSPSSGS